MNMTISSLNNSEQAGEEQGFLEGQAASGGPPRLPTKPIRFALHFIKQFWYLLLPIFVLETIQAILQNLIPSAVRVIIDSGSSLKVPFAEAVQTLKPQLGYFIVLCVGVLFVSRTSGALLVMTGPSLRKKVRQTVYHYLQYHSHRYFTGNFSGSLASRISEVSMGVNHSLWTMMFDFWPVLVSFSTAIYLVYQAHVTMAFFLSGWVIFYVVISFILATFCQKRAKRAAAMRSVVTGKIVDSVTNIMNTKLFSRLSFERDYLTEYFQQEVNATRQTLWFMEGMRWFQFISTTILQVSMIVLALYYWVGGQMTVGTFAMVTSLSLLVINDARGLSRRFLEFFEYIGNIADGVEIIIKPHEVLDRPNAQPLKVTEGRIEFNHVAFAYSDERTIFKDLSVTIQPGQKVGLVGYSGSGKTTFVNLILRMYDLNGGQIRIDGQSIADCQQDDLREQISMIPQDPLLFHRTLMENIRYGKLTASDDEVIVASKAARAHEFIMQLKDGYQSLVGERGVKLSGGQRQRVAIARAILKDSRLVLLDEATSSLDSVTEKLIQKSLTELMVGRTVVVIAHRLSTIAHLDRILVFDRGEIVEDGSHQELIARDGHYAKLWNMQAGGFLPQKSEHEGEELAH